MKEQVEIERVLVSSEKALVYANKEKWKYKDRCVELEKLLKECRDDVNHIISNVHLCKELLDLKTKIDEVLK